MSSALSVVERRSEDGLWVDLSGELDIMTAQQLKDRLFSIIDKSKGDLNINCEGLTYIDSTGLGVFVGSLNKAREHGAAIRIHHLKDNLRKLFMITGLDKVFLVEG